MNALFYVPLLAMLGVFSWILAIFLSHYFLVVVESSAAGGDVVQWPDEPLLDWFWKVFYLGFIAGIWLAPSLAVGRALGTGASVPIFAAVFFGLIFPISLLSSMSAPTKWLPLFPPLIPRLGQRASAVFAFYLWSSIPLGVGAWAMWVILGYGAGGLLILAAILFPLALMIYGRLLGRLAFVLTFTNDRKKKKRKRRRPSQQGAESSDPWAEPEEYDQITTRPSEAAPHSTIFGDVVGYDLKEGNSPPPPPAPSTFIHDEDSEPVGVVETGEEEVAIADPIVPPPSNESADRRLRREEEHLNTEHLPEPKVPFDSTMLTFMLSPGSLRAFLTLAFGFAIVGGIIQLMSEVKPT